MHIGSQDNTAPIRLAIVVTVPTFFVHLINNIKEYQKNNFDVELISSAGEYATFLRETHGFKVTEIEIPREISPFQDLKALWNLYRHLRRNKIQVAHSGTPKAGLLVAIAGFCARTPVRIHTFTGQRWATLTGRLRRLLKFLDRIIILLNTRVYADSPSQIQYLIDEKVAKPGEVFCLNKGSFGGIDPDFFDRTRYPQARAEVMKMTGFPSTAPWILYVGRVTENKGLRELMHAFQNLSEKSDARLLVLGDFENINANDDADWMKILTSHPHIKHVPFQTNPEFYMAACDFLCLPSYREGFGTVVLEAAASGLCAIGTDIPGLRDSILHGESGILVPVKDSKKLESALARLVEDPQLRITLGNQAKNRARKHFHFRVIADLQMKDYRELLRGSKS